MITIKESHYEWLMERANAADDLEFRLNAAQKELQEIKKMNSVHAPAPREPECCPRCHEPYDGLCGSCRIENEIG